MSSNSNTLPSAAVGATLLLVVGLVCACASHAFAETLQDALEMAYQSNPGLQAERDHLRATDEEQVQAEVGYRPTISANESYNYSTLGLGQPTPTTATGTEGAIALTQPLYTGGRVASQVDTAHADILAQRAALSGAEAQMMFNVIQAYVDVRRDREVLKIEDAKIDVLAQQMDQTQAQFLAGDVTRTDIAQAQARLAQAKSDRAASGADLQAAEASYAAVVGHAPADLAPEPSLAELIPATLDAAFEAAEDGNPQLEQAKFFESAATARVAGAKAQYRPTIGLTGSFGYTSGAVVENGQLISPGAGGPFANVSPYGSVMVTATIPIFSGGLNASQVRQAAASDAEAKMTLENVRRELLQTVAASWSKLEGERASIAADEEQVKANTLAYEGAHEEQKAGFRTVIDVLNAEQELAASQLALANAHRDEYLATASLLAAIGSLQAKNLIPSEPRYDPEANYRKVSHAFGSVPWTSLISSVDRLGRPAETGPSGSGVGPSR